MTICDTHLEVQGEEFTEATPGPGDFSLCLHCRSLNVYELDPDGQLAFRGATGAELVEFKTLPAHALLAEHILD